MSSILFILSTRLLPTLTWIFKKLFMWSRFQVVKVKNTKQRLWIFTLKCQVNRASNQKFPWNDFLTPFTDSSKNFVFCPHSQFAQISFTFRFCKLIIPKIYMKTPKCVIFCFVNKLETTLSCRFSGRLGRRDMLGS